MGTFGMWRASPQRNDAVRIITGVRYLLQPPVRISAAWRSSSALAAPDHNGIMRPASSPAEPTPEALVALKDAPRPTQCPGNVAILIG